MPRENRRAALAFGSGLVFATATPPIDFTPGILLGLVGYAAAGSGARQGLCFGFAANLVALRFVPEVVERFASLPRVLGWVALVLLAALQAVPWTLGSALAARLGDSEDAATPDGSSGGVGGWRALVFAVGVYVATLLPAVFPWTPAGGLAQWPALLQTAELVGERGTTFALALVCALVARRTRRSLASAAALLALLVGYGALRMRSIDGLRSAAPHAEVALVQPDFDASFRWDPARAGDMIEQLSTLTKRAEASGANLTVWPESAYPYTLGYGVNHSPSGARALLQLGVRGPVLTGAYLSKSDGVGTNSALLVRPDGEIPPSADKRHLLWFGETVPLADTFPIIRRVFARGIGLDPGSMTVALEAGTIRAAVLNCYEDTLPVAGREAIGVSPNLLVNITNDAWFAGSAEGELHLRLAVLRAIETRRDLVRAVNRGPTSWVDAAGRIRERAYPPRRAVLVEAALLDGPTPYARFGEWPLALVLAISIVTKHYGRLSRREKAPVA